VPISPNDATCDGVDDNCDGFVDEDVDLATSCGNVGPCETSVCSPVSGTCETSRRTTCCESDPDCVTPSACWSTRCEVSAQSCVLTPVAGCCTTASDCDDGNACTQEACDATSGMCSTEWTGQCCQSNADCDDDDPCTYDECAGSRRCQHRPATCATSGPCGVDTACVFSSVYLSTAATTDAVEVPPGVPTAVLRLELENDALPANLDVLAVRLVVPAAGILARGDWSVALHADHDGDGLLDADSAPLATAAIDTPGLVTLGGIGAQIPPASTRAFLLVIERRPTYAAIPLLSLGLAGVLIGRRPRRRHRRLLLGALALLGLLSATCGRTGFHALHECELTIEDASLSAGVNEALGPRHPLRERDVRGADPVTA